MSLPTPQRLMLKELKRKAVRKQKRYLALDKKIEDKRTKKALRAQRVKRIPFVKPETKEVQAMLREAAGRKENVVVLTDSNGKKEVANI